MFSEQSSYAKALQYEVKALKLFEETKNLEKCARLYNNIGIVYKAKDADFKALNYFVKCFKIQEKIGDETIGIATTNIGNIYLHQQNFPKALEYYIKAQQLFTKYPNPRGLGELYNNLGLYYKMNNNINSIQLFDVQGRLLQTDIVYETSKIIDISSKAKGVYFLKVLSDKGSKVEKIVKE